MGFNDFWISNNGKKEQLNNGKHGVRKEQVDKKFHNLFDAYDVNGDGTLENEELEGIFTGLTKFSGTDKTLDSVENKQVSSLFENQAGIKDADFMGFVKSVSDASEEIVSSSTSKGVDGGNVITTTYKNGMVETIYYYPDGEFKLKTQKQDSVTETTTYVYTNDGKEYKQCSQVELDKMIKADYKKYKAANSQNGTRRNTEFSSINIIMGPDVHKSDYMKRHDVNPCTNRSEIHIDNTDMSERAQAEAEIRDFVVSHFVQTHKDCQSALDTMGILDDIGAAINAGAGELWNSCKNIYNKHFGDGTESDYQNFYELVKKFEPNYGKALVAEGSLAEMRVHPVGYFTGETGKIDAEKGLQFQQTTERYQNATILKARIDILKDAMLEISMYENEQNALTYAPAQSEGMNPASHILKANNLLLQYFDGDKEAVNMLLSGAIGNAQSTINAIKGIADDTQKMFDTVTNGKSFDEIKNDYQTQYKAIYGTDFVPDELTEKVMDAKATGGMVKLAAITAISILITKSPVMAEISAAAGGAEVTGAAANMIRTLVSRYGATAVQQGIKFAMTSGTLASDAILNAFNRITSESKDFTGYGTEVAGSAKYIFFGAYIGAPLAQAVSKQLGKIGATTKLFEGGVKSANGAIQTTTITGDKLVQNLMKGGNKVLTTGGAFLTDVAAFSALEVATEGIDPLTAGKEQTEMLGKLKIMNHFIEYMLGGKVHAGMSKAQMDATIERSGVKNWQIKEIKSPNKTVYEVEVGEGLPLMRFEDKNELATAMLERVTASYSEGARPQTKTQEIKPEGDVKATPEIEVLTETARTESRINIPAGKFEAPNAKFAETDDAFRSIVTKRFADIKELDKISDIDEFCRKSFELMKEEMGLEDSDIKLEITDKDNYYDHETNTVYISRNWTGHKLKHVKGKGDKAEIFGGIAHELNHYLQWKEIVLNFDSKNPNWNKIISYLQQFEGAQKNIEYLIEKYPDNTELKEAFEKAKSYQDNLLNYTDAFDENGKLKTGAEYDKYRNQTVEAESFRRGDIVAEEYRKTVADVKPEGAEENPLLTRLEIANDRESFVAIRDEIKKMPNGEEKTQMMQAYLKKYNEWSTAPERPDIRMEYKNELRNNDILNQDTDEVRTMINNTITRLRQTSNGEDITLKINGEEQVYQAYKGNLGNNGSYYVTDGKNIYTILPIQSKAMCEEKILADELYSQLLGCFSKEEAVVETDTGYGIMTKSYFRKGGFSRNKAIVKTYAMDALLSNMENVVVNTTGSESVTISNNAKINLLHHPNGNPKMGQAIVPELALMFQQKGNNSKDLKSASKEELVTSLQQVADIPDEKLLEIVNNSQIENKEQLGNLLIQRKAFIRDFLSNLKNTEQAGLPIEEHILKVYQKTYAEYNYDNLKSKGNTEFTEFISEKFDIPKQDLLSYQKILNNPELAEHITEKINDGSISKEDLIEFNEDVGNFGLYWQESPTLKKEIFNALLELKKEQGISMKDGYLLILKIAQNDRAGQFSKDAVEQIKIINRELKGNTNAGLYRIILNEGTINQEKLDFIKDLQNRGIDDKYLVLLTEHILNPDRTINNEKLTALKGLFDKNINPEDIPMYFTAINTPEGLDAKMLLIVDNYKELGFDNDNITRNILSSRVRTKEGFVQKTHALELPLLFPEEIANAKLLNDAVREFSLWAPSVENQIKSAIEKNPNIKLADLVGFMQTLHKNNTFDSDGFSTGFRLLQDGVSSDNLSSFIAVSKITANSINNLTPEEALKQTIRLRSTGEILLDHDLTPIQVARLLDVAKTGGQIDKFALDIIENQFNNYTPEELLCLINYSKVIPQDGIPLEVTNNQRQQILDNITDIMKNKGCSVIDACKSISPALNLRKIGLSKSEIIGINENTLSFCRKCAENDIAAGDIQLLAYNSKILDNVSNFSPEELSAKQQQMLSWADKLLFEDKLPAKTVAKFIDVAAFKTSGKIGVRPATYNFDNNVINIINRMINEKAITSESSADISKVILAFKTLDYDENAIAKAIDLLKNPITLKNGKQYNMDAESIGYFVGGSKNKETGKFDIDIFNRNVDIYILKAEHGFSIQEMVMLSKLYKNELTINRLSTAQKVNLLNKISYASKDAIELIQEKVIETKNPDGSIINGEIDVLTRKLLTDINLASRNIRTNQTQRQEFLRNFISNKGRNPETGLNNIETKISEFDFTQYGKEGLPLKYSRDEFIANIQQILENLSPEDKAAVLKFHNIDLGENGFNSNPRVRQFNQPVEFLTNDGYKNIINELSTILKGVNEDNLQIFKENNIDTIVKKCMQLSTLDDVKISELETEFPELKFDTIKELQQKAREFAELTSNNDVDNLPTPLAVKTANEEIEAFNNFSPEIKKASERIEEEYKKFMYENEFQTDDPELNNILNGIMRGLPDVMLTVGKKQHQTHAYSVDVHTMEVLKKAMNDPEYKTLSDSDRTILKFSILLHDFGKKYINPTTPDTGHEIDSAEIASGIMAQFKLSAKVKERILNIIKNHDWFARYNKNEWNANKVAALFRSPDDYKIAKIMSKADLFSINPDFQYSPRVLNITENRTIENASKVFDQKLENLDAAYQKMYAKTNIVMNSKILNAAKIPMDEEYGVRVLNLTDENIPSDMDLGQYGMNGTTKDNLRLTVHMVAEDNLLGNLESAKLGMETTTNDNNVWSISMIKMDRTRTYMHREYGFATDTPISSIAIASPNNLSSGYEKGTDKFVELLFTDNPQRNFLKQKFIQSAYNQGSRISEADYQELSRLVYNKSFLSQLETKTEIEVNGNIYPTSVIVKAIQESTDALFTGQTHTEFVATNPKIQGLVVRKNSMDEVAPDFIAFAKKYNLPILLVGNK